MEGPVGIMAQSSTSGPLSKDQNADQPPRGGHSDRDISLKVSNVLESDRTAISEGGGLPVKGTSHLDSPSGSRSSGSSATRDMAPSVLPGEIAAVEQRAAERPLSGSSASQAPAGDHTVISQDPPVPVPGTTASPAATESLLGEWLDHFQLLEFVGGGGMGVVFRARDSRLDRTVALKILSSDRARDRETVRRFRNEAQSAARLDHDNIARVYYVGEDRGLNYIAFEYVDGTNMRDLVVERGPLPVAEAVDYMMQLAHALSHASGRNVIHRDIKPSNVLVTRNGRVKLVDMGLARLSQVQHTDDLTASGVTLGTFDYISPEQARDPRSADVRSDIYSLGCTFYFMLTGRPPFPNGNVLQKLLQHQGDTPPDPRDTNPGIPEEVVRVLRRMLVKEPGRRYQDAGALIVDLSRLAEQLGIDLSNLGAAYVAQEPAAWSRWLQRNLPWLAPVLALGVALLVLDSVWSRKQPPAENWRPSSRFGPPVQSLPENLSPSPAVESTSQPGTSPVAITRPDMTALRVAAVSSAAASDPASTDSASLAASSGGSGVQVAAFDAHLTWNSGSTLPTSVALRFEDVPAVELPPAAEPHPPGLLVVRPGAPPMHPYEFATLAEACNAADAGDVIELRYTGRQIEPAVRVTRAVTIRAGTRPTGEPHRPVLVFSPDETDTARSMFSIAGVKLSLRNVVVEMNLPLGGLNGAWTMAELQQGELEAEQCVFSLTRPLGHETPSFFCVRADQRAESMMMNPAMIEPVVRRASVGRVRLVNCIARGEAVLVFAEQMAPLLLEWQNGLFASMESLLKASGGVMEQGSSRITLNLDHLTALIPGGLCVLETSDDYPRLVPLDVRCSNSILVGSGGRPLIDVSAAEPVGLQQGQLSWQGIHNVYDGFSTLWSLRDRTVNEPSHDLNASLWQEYWGTDREQQAFFGPVQWRGGSPLGANVSLDHHQALEYQIQSQFEVDHPASDEGPVGMQFSRLPTIPLASEMQPALKATLPMNLPRNSPAKLIPPAASSASP